MHVLQYLADLYTENQWQPMLLNDRSKILLSLDLNIMDLNLCTKIKLCQCNIILLIFKYEPVAVWHTC